MCTFVCIEIGSVDVLEWNKIDKLMADEFGYTHCIWGINNNKEKTKEPCKLPSNLFCGECNLTVSDLRTAIKTRLDCICATYGYALMVMGDDTWASEHKSATTVTTPTQYTELDDVSRSD